jgi:hypothetical protein
MFCHVVYEQQHAIACPIVSVALSCYYVVLLVLLLFCHIASIIVLSHCYPNSKQQQTKFDLSMCFEILKHEK